jgi:hypothetical protein
MSMFEIVPPEPVVVSDKLAEKILQFIGSFMHADCSSMAEALFAAVPELKLVDNALTTMETVYNDCLLTQQGISDLDGKNLAATMDNIQESFQALTGHECRPCDFNMDPGAGREPEDGEDEDEDAQQPTSEDGNQVAHPAED